MSSHTVLKIQQTSVSDLAGIVEDAEELLVSTRLLVLGKLAEIGVELLAHRLVGTLLDIR